MQREDQGQSQLTGALVRMPFMKVVLEGKKPIPGPYRRERSSRL